jgi:hypothetical protein
VTATTSGNQAKDFRVAVTLKEAGGKYDTGFNDAEVFMEYIRDKTLVNLPEERIRVIR